MRSEYAYCLDLQRKGCRNTTTNRTQECKDCRTFTCPTCGKKIVGNTNSKKNCSYCRAVKKSVPNSYRFSGG